MARQSNSLRVVLKVAALSFLSTFTTGFTFLFSPPAKLPSTLEAPEVPFVWDGVAPPLSKKDVFREGIFDGQTDAEVMRTLIEEAMTSWNDVAGSYVRLTLLDTTDEVKTSAEDRIFSIVVDATGNFNAAAFASPVVDREESDGTTIVDCDITVDGAEVEVSFMLYALTHELGHCLGIGHAHDNYKSLMGYSRTPGKGAATLGADDKAAVIYLYPDPAYGDPAVEQAVMAECGVVGRYGTRASWPMAFILALPIITTLVHRRRKIAVVGRYDSLTNRR